MLSCVTNALKLQRGGAKKGGPGGMFGLFIIVLVSLLIKSLLVQLSWNMVMPRLLTKESSIRDTITFSEALMLVILVSNLL
jgi:hypothetical protein